MAVTGSPLLCAVSVGKGALEHSFKVSLHFEPRKRVREQSVHCLFPLDKEVNDCIQIQIYIILLIVEAALSGKHIDKLPPQRPADIDLQIGILLHIFVVQRRTHKQHQHQHLLLRLGIRLLFNDALFPFVVLRRL